MRVMEQVVPRSGYGTTHWSSFSLCFFHWEFLHSQGEKNTVVFDKYKEEINDIAYLVGENMDFYN